MFQYEVIWDNEGNEEKSRGIVFGGGSFAEATRQLEHHYGCNNILSVHLIPIECESEGCVYEFMDDNQDFSVLAKMFF